MTQIHGPDISFWQDDNASERGVDFAKMRAAGATFVIIRAGQNTWPDPDFKANYQAAKDAGLPRGVYWFYDSRSTPMSQAILCTSQIDGDKPELGVWADYEENYQGKYKGWQHFKSFCQALDVRFPLVGIYTGPSYWMTNRPTGSADLAYFKSKPLWIANYGVNTPLVPSPWDSWLFWQYTSSGDGLRYGVESKEIDLNHFYGDEQTFRNYFDLGEIPQPEEENDMAITTAMWDAMINALIGIKEAIKDIEVSGGGDTPPPPPADSDGFTTYRVVENDVNPNKKVIVCKVPDDNDTNKDTIWVGGKPQEVIVIDRWQDVPALVYWKDLSDINKMNTYDEWACVVSTWMWNANNNRVPFPNIFVAGGTTRATHCWIHRADLGAKV